MKILFKEEKKQVEVLFETENTEGLSAMFDKHSKIQITRPREILHCKYIYNVVKVVENEIDIFVEIDDITEII
jgi:hypothetical protein